MFLDNIRTLMVVLVVVHHSVAAYAIIAPHWTVHDTNTLAADIIRELLDVFMMPVLFFAAGYFALASLKKKGLWGFLKDKVKRLFVPWALAVLIILPLAIYDQPVKPIRPFWKYWLSYLGSFEARLRFTQAPVGPTTQAVYWFISLLFAFFLLFALIYAVARRWRGGDHPAVRKLHLRPLRARGSGGVRARCADVRRIFYSSAFRPGFELVYAVHVPGIPGDEAGDVRRLLCLRRVRAIAGVVCRREAAGLSDDHGAPVCSVLAVAYLVFGKLHVCRHRGDSQPDRRIFADFRFSPVVSPVVDPGHIAFVRRPLLELRERA